MFRGGVKAVRYTGVYAAVAVASLIAVPNAAASSEASRNLSKDSIEQFVDRVHDKFGLTIDAEDYELRARDGETLIVRKDAPAIDVRTTAVNAQSSDDERIEKTFTLGKSSPPNPTEARRQAAEGDVTIQQGISWYQSDCWSNSHAPLEDEDDAGWMDACTQWGDMNYQAATRANYAFRMYGTCKPGEADFYEITGCWVDTVKHSDSARLYWNDWSPKSTVDLGGCGQVQLQVGVGPVSGGAIISTCDKIVPERGAAPADMRTRWVGDAYWKDEVRQTGQIVGVGVDYGETIGIASSFGYSYSPCSFSSLLDLCG